MRCFHLQVVQGSKTEMVHINADSIETLSVKGDGTAVTLSSGNVLLTAINLEEVLRRIDEAPCRHVTNGG